MSFIALVLRRLDLPGQQAQSEGYWRLLHEVKSRKLPRSPASGVQITGWPRLARDCLQRKPGDIRYVSNMDDAFSVGQPAGGWMKTCLLTPPSAAHGRPVNRAIHSGVFSRLCWSRLVRDLNPPRSGGPRLNKKQNEGALLSKWRRSDKGCS